jgi:hypothetical protein
MSSIFGVEDGDRQLPNQRLDSISASQEALLIAFVSFIDENLVQHGSSHEKRGVFLKLINDLLRLTPANLIPIVLSKSMVRCIVSIRINKKHTLFALAGVTLSTLVNTMTSDRDDARGCLAIANSLVQHEGAMFDAKTNSSTVKDLLSGLDSDMVMSYVHTLCEVIAKALTPVSAAEKEGSDDDEEEEVGDGAEQAVSAVLALAAIVKNPRMANRGNLAAVIVSVLVRIVCFLPEGSTPTCSWTAQTPKKGGKKSKKSAAHDHVFSSLNMSDDKELINSMIDIIHVIESRDSTIDVESPILEQIVQTARTSLMNVLADVGHASITYLNESLALMENGKSDKKRSDSITESDKVSSLLHYALVLFIYLSDSGLVFTSDDAEDEDDMDGRDCTKKVKVALLSLWSQLESSHVRLVQSCMTFLGQSVFHVMCSEEVGQDCLEIIAEVIPSVAQTTHIKTNSDKSLQLKDEADEEEDGDEVEDGFQTALFEACMDLVAVSDKHPVKGIRDAIKRLWSNVVQYCLVESSVIESILACVVGDDVDGAEESNKGNRDKHDHGESDVKEDEEEDEEEEEDEPPTKVSKKDKQQKKTSEGSDSEEEDIMLDEESTMKLLEGSDSEKEDDDDSDVDEEGMDAALANMIQMRKQNRKQGLLQAKRQELIVRSRAIDILEVFIHRNEDTSILLPMFFPLLFCLKKITNSSIVQSLQEGRTFEQRVRSVIENKLCKAKFSIVVEGEEEISVFVESTSELLQFIVKCLRSASVPMRATATQCFLCVSRGVISGGMKPTVDLLSSSFKELLVEYFNKKNCRVPVKIVDEMFSRFPDFCTSSCLEEMIQAGASAPSLFLRTDAFRLLSSVLRKNSSLVASTQQLLLDHLNDMVVCTSNTILSNEDMKAKRMKSILQFAKDLAQFMKASATGGATKIDSASVDTFQSALSEGITADNKQKTSREAICDILSSIPGSALSSTTKTGKKQKGKKGVDSAIAVPVASSNGNQKEGVKKTTRKKRGSAEMNDDDENFVDYEREMINKMAAEAKKHMPTDEEVVAPKSKGKKQKSKK